MNTNQRLLAKFDSMANDEFLGFDDQLDESYSADGGGQVAVSEPYIIKVSANLASVSGNNFKLFDAARNVYASGNGVGTGYTVTNEVSGVDYADFLAFLIGNPVQIGMIHVYGSSTSLASNSLTPTQYDLSGKTASETIFFTSSPFQDNTDIMVSEHGFMLTERTYIPIDWSSFGSSGTITATYRLYPTATGLRPEARDFVKPTVDQAGTLRVANRGLGM